MSDAKRATTADVLQAIHAKGCMTDHYLELEQEVLRLRTDLQEQKDNRNRDLTAFKHVIHEKKELAAHVAALTAQLSELKNEHEKTLARVDRHPLADRLDLPRPTTGPSEQE